MILVVPVLLVSFFLFLYILYYLSHDDFVIVRRDIAMDRIFNMAFVVCLAALFFSRAVFAISSRNPAEFLNPLVFAALPYFPGLSLVGAVTSGSLLIYAYTSYKKLPKGKMFDLFAMSFLGALPLGFMGIYIVLLGKTGMFFNLMFIYSVILLFLFAKLIYPYSIRGEIKDGSLGFIFVALFSALYFLTKMFLHLVTFSFLDPENFILLVTLFSSLILLVNQEIMDKFLAKK